MNKKIVTNLRMDEADYLRAKARAADLGMSLNQYFIYLANVVAPKNLISKSQKPRKSMYQALIELAKEIHDTPRKPMGVSEEDKAIYDIDD